MLSDGKVFNLVLVVVNLVRWCGWEVKIYKVDGNEFIYSGGSFYIWDGCDVCFSFDLGIFDFFGVFLFVFFLMYYFVDMW